MALHMSSLRSIELLVSEFSHLALRRPRARVLFYRQKQHVRLFGSRAALRQDGTGTVAREDEGSTELRPQMTMGMGEEEGDAVGSQAETKGERDAEMFVEAHMQHLDSNIINQLSTTNATDSNGAGEGNAAPQESRVVGRLKRRLRRMQEGTYRPSDGVSGERAEEWSALIGRTEAKIREVKEAERRGEDPSTKGNRQVKESRAERRARIFGTALSGAEEGVVEAENEVRTMGSESAESQNEPIAVTSTSKPKPEASDAPPPPSPSPSTSTREPWQIQKAALTAKFGTQGWNPRKRLSPDALEGIRALHKSDPAAYSTAVLAQHFKISPEAIRRVLKSKWRPSEEQVVDRQERWERRGVRKWTEMSEKGMRPPAPWRARGVVGPRGRERMEKKTGTKEDRYVQWAD